MEKCIIMGNGYELRRTKRLELMEMLKCEEQDVELEIGNYSKVDIIHGDIVLAIGGEPISDKKNPGVYSILGEDQIVAIHSKIKILEQIYEINICEKSYGDNGSVKTLEVELSINEIFKKFEDIFYEMKLKIKNCIKNYYKEVYFIEDTQNAKACMELYRMVYSNENKFRSIINNHMVINYGVNWFNTIIDKAYRDSVLQLNKWYREQTTAEFKDVKCELYNLLIDDLIEMLKDSQIEGASSLERKQYIEFVNKLGNNSTLQPLLEGININKESIWEKDFSRHISIKFEEEWNEYKNMRNMVAHNKLICRSIINKIAECSEKIYEELQSIEQNLEILYKDNESRYIQKIYDEMADEFYIEEAGGASLPEEEDLLLEIEEDDDYSTMMNEVDELLGELKDLREEVSWLIEEVVEYCRDEDNVIERDEVARLYQLLEIFSLEDDFNRRCIMEITSQELINQFIRQVIVKLEDLQEKIVDADYFKIDSFKIGELIRYTDIHGQDIRLSSTGLIMPSRGATDNIKIELYIGEKCIKRGFIEKQYFDYSIHEDGGYSMPEIEEYLNVELEELSNEVLAKIREEISILETAIQIFELNFEYVF